MVKRDAVVEFLDSYLDIAGFRDGSWNGLQLEGRDEVGRIMFAVDAGVETFERAVAERADMIVVHHGHFWSGVNPSVVGWCKRRLDILMRNDISLYAVHLPLDAHPVVGNNARLLGILGAKATGGFAEHHGRAISFTGELQTPAALDELTGRLETALDTHCRLLPFGPPTVRTVALVSGGGSMSDFTAALAMGVDLYLTGDATEIYHTARDGAMNVIFAGHHATETVGVKALGEVVAEEMGVETSFVDIRTGL
jgi:dinuclear metal center YbgI/SA1388 family protein